MPDLNGEVRALGGPLAPYKPEVFGTDSDALNAVGLVEAKVARWHTGEVAALVRAFKPIANEMRAAMLHGRSYVEVQLALLRAEHWATIHAHLQRLGYCVELGERRVSGPRGRSSAFCPIATISWGESTKEKSDGRQAEEGTVGGAERGQP